MLVIADDRKPYINGEQLPITDPTLLGLALQDLLENTDFEVWIMQKANPNEYAVSATKLHTVETTNLI